MFQWLLILISLFFFMPLSSQAQKTKLKKKVLNKKKLEVDESVSLMELLNDTDQLKNEIKRDLAKGDEEEIPVRLPTSKQKRIEFGNMYLGISERQEEDLQKPRFRKKASKKQAKRLKSKL